MHLTGTSMLSFKVSISALIFSGIVVVILALYLYLTNTNFNIFTSSKDVSTELTSDNLDYLATAGSFSNYTGQYLKEYDLIYPASDQTELDQFIEQNRGQLYKPASLDDLTTSDIRGSEAMTVYLDFISSSDASPLQPITSEAIEDGFNQILDTGDATALEQLIASLEQNETILRDRTIPVEAATLHAKLLGATTSLRQNLTLMHYIDTDYVGGLIGARNVDDLVAVFNDIVWDIQELEQKYEL